MVCLLKGKTWKKVNPEVAQKIKEYLIKKGGDEQKVSQTGYEEWRVNLLGSTFTYYTSRTLYATPSKVHPTALHEVSNFINTSLEIQFLPSNKPFCIGLDEVGKGEVIGQVFLVGVFFPQKLSSELEILIQSSNTKEKRPEGYWQELAQEILSLKKKGFSYLLKKISPSAIAKGNFNKILDESYREILLRFCSKFPLKDSRIVIDDYRVGNSLREFLKILVKKGAEIIISPKSEEKYLETRVASIIAKRERAQELKRINEQAEFKINNLTVGSGNLSDPQTLAWLKAWQKSGKSWPWFVKYSFKPIRNGKLFEINSNK
jgi:ribonuclease HII